MSEHYGVPHPLSRNPNGWFAVALSHEIAPGDVKPVSCLGRDLVLFRTERGVAGLLDAYCPHVGAHLGHGGCVEGEALRCPFHRWAFDVTGLCVDIPYSRRRNVPKARTQHWDVVERNGAILAWFDAAGGAPSWQVEVLPSEQWSPTVWLEMDYVAHIQDFAENGIDTGHFASVHGSKRAILQLLQTDSVPFHQVLKTAYPGDGMGLPGQLVNISTEWKYYGLGILFATSTAEDFGATIRHLFHFTPIPDDHVLCRIGFAADRTTIPEEMIEHVLNTNRQMTADHFDQDRILLKYKRHRSRPMLSDGDGPFGVFRRWTRQFYAATTGTDRTVIDRWEPLSVFDVTAGAQPVRPANGGGAEREDAPIAITPSASSSPPAASQASETNGATIADLRSDAQAIQTTFFERLPATFNPTAAAGREFVIQYDIAGDGGGKYFVEVRNGTCSPAAGEHPAPTVRVLVDAGDWLKINAGTLNRAKAFMTGRLRVQGDMALAIKLGEIFPH